MNPDNENTPIGDNEDQFTEGSYQAIKKKEEGADNTENTEEKKDTTKTITDIQNDTDPGSREDVAREQGPYGVQE
jgi:hypothetical protein